MDEAFEALLDAIGKARHSIRFEFYIVQDSEIARRFLTALSLKARAGIQVRVLVDALGSVGLADSFWNPLREAGGEFRWFNPLQLNRLGFRNHRKCVVCDDETGFVGGFNIGPEYQGDGVGKGWHDTGMRIPPGLTRELAASFDAMWTLAEHRHGRFTRLRRPTLRGVVETPEGDLVTSAPGRGPFLMRNLLAADAQKARQIDIISAYFLPPRQLHRELIRAARRGARVRLVLAGKSDVALSLKAARRLYQGYLRAGVEIHEFQPQILHTKLYLFDGLTYVGSANMDNRSLTINYELLVRTRDAELSASARAFFERTLAQSKQLDTRSWRASRSFWEKLKEQWAYWILARVDPYLTRVQLQVLRAGRHGDEPGRRLSRPS